MSTDTVVVITGASTGLGPVMAKMMADEGAKLVLAARRKELVDQAAQAVGDAAVAVQADVTKEEDVARMVGVAMDRWGQVDVMMNNVYPQISAFVSFPPLVITRNEIKKSTVQMDV